MTARRSRGDGGLSWDSARQRWVASLTVGYTPSGKRIVKRGRGRTKTEAKRKLREILRDYEDGLVTTGHGYTVADAVRDWLAFGLSGRDQGTITKCTILANTHVIPGLGARKLRELSADDVDKWLAEMAQTLSTRSLREVQSVLKRAITRAQARDKVKRNVVLLCDIPKGRDGRPSKSLTFAQAEALLDAAQGTTLARLHRGVAAHRSPDRGTARSEMGSRGPGRRSRRQSSGPAVHRGLAIGPRWRGHQDQEVTSYARPAAAMRGCAARASNAPRPDPAAAGTRWKENGLVFPSRAGTPADASHVRRSFRRVVAAAGLAPGEWTPRELRHSFVSLLSDAGVPIEQISRLVGHSGTTTTETIYRKQIRPVIAHGADVMDLIFPVDRRSASPHESNQED